MRFVSGFLRDPCMQRFVCNYLFRSGTEPSVCKDEEEEVLYEVYPLLLLCLLGSVLLRRSANMQQVLEIYGGRCEDFGHSAQR